MEPYYKFYKFLLQDKYKELSDNAKISYVIYHDMLRRNISVKIDENGRKYIENPRKYLMKYKNISINTVTKVHKELNKAGLLWDVFKEVGKPNVVYLYECETEQPKEIHKACEAPKVKEEKEDKVIVQERPIEEKNKIIEEVKEVKKEPVIENKLVETKESPVIGSKAKIEEAKIEYVDRFTKEDIAEAEKFLSSFKNRIMSWDSVRILYNIKFKNLGNYEIELVKITIKLLTILYKNDERYQLLFKHFNDFILNKAVRRCQRRKRDGRCVAYLLCEDILQTMIDDLTENYYEY